MVADFTEHEVVPRPAMTCQYRRAGWPAIGEASRWHRVHTATCVSGRVLELGALDIADLLRYHDVDFLALVQPSPTIRDHHAAIPVPAVQLSEAPLERLPFPTAAFDVVICTFSLCSADRPDCALLEISRVLHPAGQLAFLEHTRGPGAIGRTQDHVEAMLRGSGRCRPNLAILDAVRAAGFVLRESAQSWPAERRCLHAPLVQGIAAHPDSRQERELRWLYGSPSRIPGP